MIGVIIQARMESQRLPGKVYKKICHKHLLEHVILRVKRAKSIKKVVVAIPDTKESSILLPLIKKNKVDFYQGSMDNVLDRFIKAGERFQIDYIARITADCPLIDSMLIDQSVKRYLSFKNKPDYFYIDGYPKGLGDIEILKLQGLKKISQLTKEPYHLEHVMTFFCQRQDLFNVKIEKAPPKFSRPDYRLCVDETFDLILVKKIFKHFKHKQDFAYEQVIEYLDKNPKLTNINKNVKQTQ